MADLFSFKGKRIWVAGETGMVGRAIIRALGNCDCTILRAPHAALDLTNQHATYSWLHHNKPDVVFLAAAKVGGIGANNSYPADFLRDNLSIAQNVIEGAYRANVQKLLFLGSSCIYPKMAQQPIREEALMTGPLEPTNEAYAIAKIAGLKMCEMYRRQYGASFIAAMPTNLYGPYDRFDAERSHVIPAMMMKYKKAMECGDRSVCVWGSGAALREFLHVDDLARALIVMMERYDAAMPINIGSGEDLSIASLAHLIKDVTGYTGEIEFDASKPDGTQRKLLDSSRMRALGWSPTITLSDGLSQTWDWYSKREFNLPEGQSYASLGM
jgi:GDP-L-fucose synthase